MIIIQYLYNKLLIIVPSTPPQNVTVIAINSTSIFVSWKPPIATDQNGVITSYNVSVIDLPDNNITSVIVMGYINTSITGKVLVVIYSYDQLSKKWPLSHVNFIAFSFSSVSKELTAKVSG